MVIGRYLVPDVGSWAFGAVVPGETSPVIETDNAYYVFRLDSLQEGGIAPYERVAEEVRAEATRQAKVGDALTIAQEVGKEIQAGGRLRAVAERHKIPVSVQGPFTRTNPPVQIANALPVIGAAFGLGIGQAGGPYETESGFYFVEPISRKLADSTKFAAQLSNMRLQVLQAARRERVQQVIASLRQDAKVTDRRKEMDRLQRDAEDNPQPVQGTGGR
jgi:hypothetical protein